MVWKSEAITRGEAGPLPALPVQAGAGEQEQHHETAQRQVVERLAPHVRDRVRVPDGALHDERGVDRELEAEQVERPERGDAHAGPGEVELQQPSEQGLARPDVALRQRYGLDLLKLFEKSVGHGAPRRQVVKHLQPANVAGVPL